MPNQKRLVLKLPTFLIEENKSNIWPSLPVGAVFQGNHTALVPERKFCHLDKW
jgi:hypothetical protein